MSRRINSAGLGIIRSAEGWRAETYLCPSGKPTIGYGHVLLPGESFPEGITQAQGLSLLVKDVEQAASAVERHVTVPLSENQFSALVSFVFNLGEGNLAHGGKNNGPSTLLYLLNKGDYQGAADQFLAWNKATITHEDGTKEKVALAGLTKRRKAERELFLAPDVQPQPEKEAAPERPVPFQAPTKEEVMPSWAVSLLIPTAIKLGTGLLGPLVKALLPEGAKDFGSHVSDSTKNFIKTGLDSFQAYADSTPNDTLWGKTDNVLAVVLNTVADGLGLLPADSATPPTDTQLQQP